MTFEIQYFFQLLHIEHHKVSKYVHRRYRWHNTTPWRRMVIQLDVRECGDRAEKCNITWGQFFLPYPKSLCGFSDGFETSGPYISKTNISILNKFYFNYTTEKSFQCLYFITNSRHVFLKTKCIFINKAMFSDIISEQTEVHCFVCLLIY